MDQTLMQMKFLTKGFRDPMVKFAHKIADPMQCRMTNRQWQPKSVRICQKIINNDS